VPPATTPFLSPLYGACLIITLINGSGKSTLTSVIMGHPKYTVDSGDILLDGESIVNLSPDERARRGLFLAFQYPVEISGVRLVNFLRRALHKARCFGVHV